MTVKNESVRKLARKEYKNPFAFSSKRKSKLKNIVTGSVASSEDLNDTLETRAIGKEHLDHLFYERIF